MTFDYISMQRGITGRYPVVKGTSIPVSAILTMLADGMTPEQILTQNPALEAEDIREVLLYAAETVRSNPMPANPQGVIPLDRPAHASPKCPQKV